MAEPKEKITIREEETGQTITGPSETGGVITGTSRDIITQRGGSGAFGLPSETAAQRAREEELARKLAAKESGRQEELRLAREKQELLRQKQQVALEFQDERDSVRNGIVRGEVRKAEPRSKLQQARQTALTKKLRGQKLTLKERGLSLAAGSVSNILLTGEFVKGAVTEPIKTTKGTGLALKEAGRKVLTGEGFPEAGRIIRQEPEFATGFIATELLTLKGGGAVLGKVSKGAELARGRVSPRFKGVKERALPDLGTKEKFIGNLEIGGKGEIAIIPARLEKKAPTLRPSVRGGFGFSRKEQAAFIGEKGPVVTAQAGFKAFEKPLQKELFATPPLKGRGFVRVSRLGAEPPAAGLLDFISGDIQFTRGKPQIIVFPEEKIGRKGGFKPFGQRSSELEVTTLGTIPRKKAVVGVSILEGRRVPIVSAELVSGTKEGGRAFQKLVSGEGLTGAEKRLFKKETGFQSSSFEVTKPRFTSRKVTGKTSRRSVGSRERSVASSIRNIERDISPRIKPAGRRGSSPRLGSAFSLLSISRRGRGARAGRTTRLVSFLPPPPKKPLKGIVKPRKVKKKGKKPSRIDEPLIFVPDFTSRSLGLKQRTTLKGLERQARKETGVGLRKVPILKSRKKKRKS